MEFDKTHTFPESTKLEMVDDQEFWNSDAMYKDCYSMVSVDMPFRRTRNPTTNLAQCSQMSLPKLTGQYLCFTSVASKLQPYETAPSALLNVCDNKFGVYDYRATCRDPQCLHFLDRKPKIWHMI
jgi:hypothetical protein